MNFSYWNQVIFILVSNSVKNAFEFKQAFAFQVGMQNNSLFLSPESLNILRYLRLYMTLFFL